MLALCRLQMDGKYAIAAAMALFNLQISKAIEILSTSKGQGQYFFFHFRHCQFFVLICALTHLNNIFAC